MAAALERRDAGCAALPVSSMEAASAVRRRIGYASITGDVGHGLGSPALSGAFGGWRCPAVMPIIGAQADPQQSGHSKREAAGSAQRENEPQPSTRAEPAFVMMDAAETALSILQTSYC